MVNLKINGNEIQVPDGMTVLQAAAQAGVTIPTLCDHPDLHPYGGCRLCVVEVETHSPAIEKSRRTILELFMSNYHDSGYEDGQKQETQFVHWVKHYGLD